MKITRRDDRISVWLCGGAIALLLLLIAAVVMAGQSQDAINATTTERMVSIGERVQKLEAAQNVVILALLGNVGAHLFQIKSQQRRRRRLRRDDEDEQ